MFQLKETRQFKAAHYGGCAAAELQESFTFGCSSVVVVRNEYIEIITLKVVGGLSEALLTPQHE